MSSDPPKIALLGTGKIGTALAKRLREQGHAVSLWNRSRWRAEAVKDEQLAGRCIVSDSAVMAVSATTTDSLVILTLADAAACLETLAAIRDTVGGRTVLNLTSGSPDDGRRFAACLAGAASATYIDGAHCGAPEKARQGAGVLFLSSDAGAVAVERLQATLDVLGEVCFAGGVGASRALDYAVVDLALVCYNSFFSNLEMLEREGVRPEQLYEHAAKRLATVALLYQKCSILAPL